MQAIEHFIFEQEQIGNTCWRFKNNSHFTKRKFFTDAIYKRVLKSSDSFQRNGKTMTKSFNAAGFSVSLLLRKFLMQLSISLIGNAFFFNISFKWHISEWNPEKSETIESVWNNKMRVVIYRCLETIAGSGD